MKILIADDEALVRQSVILFLLDLGIEKEDITEVNDGFLLLDAMKQHHFDLALVDIRMPGMDGLKALKSAGQFVEKANIYITSFPICRTIVLNPAEDSSVVALSF